MIKRLTARWGHIRNLSTYSYSDRPYQPLITEGFLGISKLVIPKNADFSNQIIETEKEDKLISIMDEFETKPILTYGYGSGVFEQDGYLNRMSKGPQIDIIKIVDDSPKFHETNIQQFPQHYSLMRYLGSRSISRIQNIGVGLYFNPFAVIQNTTVKYGVINQEKALLDLSEWSSLYLSGRLQKPVKYLEESELDATNLIKFINQYNLKSAMSLAVLLIRKEHFSEVELYEAIANVSYLGDFRNLIGGENPNKVKNIVRKQFQNFQKLYEPILAYFLDHGILVLQRENDGVKYFKRRLSHDEKSLLLSKMPIHFRRVLYQYYSDKSIKEIARDSNLHSNLNKTVKKIVRMPSLVQMLKGVLSAGVFKSVKYALEKNLKFRKAH